MSYLVLACSGLDKPEGAVAREVALLLAEETGAEIVCPVSLNRVPAKYQRALAAGRVVVVDGCSTRCATKLAKTNGAKISRVVLVCDAETGQDALSGQGLRLGPAGLDLARSIAQEIRDGEAAMEAAAKRAGGETATAEPPRGTAVEGTPEATGFATPADFAVVTHDKYQFRVPLSGFVLNANDVWAQVSGDRARIGISDYLQQRLTDITFVDAPAVGTTVEQFGELGSVESTKAAFEIVSPVSGRVVAVNDALSDEPDRINQDPYGSWIVEVELTAWEDDLQLLMDGPAYAEDLEQKVAFE